MGLRNLAKLSVFAEHFNGSFSIREPADIEKLLSHAGRQEVLLKRGLLAGNTFLFRKFGDLHAGGVPVKGVLETPL